LAEIVVADAGPLIAFGRLDKLSLLGAIFEVARQLAAGVPRGERPAIAADEIFEGIHRLA
jgi:hypothetical protein